MMEEHTTPAPACDQHPILRTTFDIVNEIFSYLAVDLQAPPEAVMAQRSTLRHVALSVKLMSEPALDALWHSMDSLHPAMALLPFLKEHGGPGHFVIISTSVRCNN